MEFVDPRTFLLVANLLGLLCALVLWVQAKSFPEDIEGLRDWALAVVARTSTLNDTYGHHIGDLVIKDFARRAQGMLRVPDILARFGGEGFVVLLSDTGLAEARQVAERIRCELEIQRDKALPRYTASLGVAVAQGEAGQAADIEALIAEADAALYRAKQGGRNRVES